VLGPWYQRCDLSICESLEPQVCLTLDVQLGLLVNNETGRAEGLFSNEVGGSPNTVPLDPVATALNGGSGRDLYRVGRGLVPRPVLRQRLISEVHLGTYER
jgi:hypothetical protein